MAVTLAWKVELGYPGVAGTNFTSRVAGIDIDQQIALNVMANFTARVTLNNFDGALTPNGGGTYGTTNWFQQSCTISATTSNGTSSSTVTTMFGIVTGFDLYDDGETSTVTLTITDLWTVAGRTKQATVTAISEQGARAYIEASTTTGQFAAAFPIWGYTAYALSIINLGTVLTRTIKSTVNATDITFADLLNQLVLPSQNGFMWPGEVTAPSTDLIIYAYWVGAGLTKDAPRTTFVFDPPAAMTSTDLPFVDIKQGYNIDSTINTATMTSLDQPFGALPITSTNSASANAYGSRSINFGQAVALAGNVSDTMTELTNRFSSPTFGPVSLTVTASAIKSYCANAAYTQVATLLGMSSLADKAVITWTGAGLSTTQTANCAILGKRIRATPSDTEITLTLGNWADFHSFILDTDKLDTDRLG